MIIKSLIYTAIIYFLIQVLPAIAGTPLQTKANNAPVLIKVSNDCSAQVITRPTTVVSSQLFVDLNKGDLFPGEQVFKVTDLPNASKLIESLDYDAISDANIMNSHVNEVPIPAAGWLKSPALALVGFITFQIGSEPSI